MGIPADWETRKRSLPDAEEKNYIGHEDQGSTIALHSLAVKVEHQRKRVGSTLIKSYVQRMKDAAIADRIALLAHDHMVPFYESLGFKNYGPSACTFGGGGWFDMVSSSNLRSTDKNTLLIEFLHRSLNFPKIR
jgi:predicted N-acetyltransferase YhbS